MYGHFAATKEVAGGGAGFQYTYILKNQKVNIYVKKPSYCSSLLLFNLKPVALNPQK